MTSSAHAAWLHLCPASVPVNAAISAGLTRADGSAARLIVNNEPVLAGCPGIPLPGTAEMVEAIHPLPARTVPGNTILIQGTQQDGRFAVAGVSVPDPAPVPVPAVPMPLHTNLLASAQVRSFGAEERVSARLAEGRLDIVCRSGRRPAGLLLGGPWHLPAARLAVEFAYAGSGQIAVEVADAARASAETALAMGMLAGTAARQTTRLALPAGLERAAWKQFVLVCPAREATLTIDALRLVPLGGTSPPRATWIWQANAWRTDAVGLLDWAEAQGLRELFIAVPMETERIAAPDALAAFVRAASRRRIAVWSVDGDPRMVLPGGRADALRRARAYAAYNASADEEARLRGMQFDVEPYLLPGYDSRAPEFERGYVELVTGLRKAAGSMRLDMVVPYWWAGKTLLLRALAPAVDGLVVMDYRTDAQDIYRFATPFLDWGQAAGKRIRIALEAGPVAPETQRRYARAQGAGRLLLTQVEGMQVLVLLKEPQQQAGTAAFALTGTRVFDGSATSFHTDKAALARVLPDLERDFAAWSSFAGMAVHELR